MAPTAVTCGLPSSFTVASQVVRALCASGAGAAPAASFSTMAVQSTGGRPSAAPKLVIFMVLSSRERAGPSPESLLHPTSRQVRSHRGRTSSPRKVRQIEPIPMFEPSPPSLDATGDSDEEELTWQRSVWSYGPPSSPRSDVV